MPGYRNHTLLNSKIFYLAIFFLVSSCIPIYARTKTIGFFGTPGVALQAGYTATMWSPRGLSSYEITTYGRNQGFLEARMQHPLLIISEALNFVSIPRLRVETNFGYQERSSDFVEVLPSYVRENPYFNAMGWATLFEFVSLRFRSEQFSVKVADPNTFWIDVYDRIGEEFGDFTTEVAELECVMQEIEIGLIGSPDGYIHPTMYEFGYFHTSMTRPIAFPSGTTTIPILMHPDIKINGWYFMVNSDPVPGVWPLKSQVGFKFGSGHFWRSEYEKRGPDVVDYGQGFTNELDYLSLELRLAYERGIYKNILAGISTQTSVRFISSRSDKDVSASDTRYRLNLYTIFTII